MLVMVLDVTLILGLPHAFLAGWFINSFSAHAVFERSIEGGQHTLSGTSSDGQSGWLEQVAQVLAAQSQEKLSVNR